jgi:uncharacterized Zn-binding protein involved in type VI secretion
MFLQIIIVGDITDHGGKVVTGSPKHDIDGKAIARCGCKLMGNRRGSVG